MKAGRSRAETPAGTYRTLCVRLCDGFYFPISFATTRGKFRDDASRCERQCPTGARLFVHRNPGETVDEMVDLDGAAYTKLPIAFRFRENYDARCTCHGNPWDAEALARHQSYAQQPQPPPAVVKADQSSPAPQRHRQSSWGYRAREDE